MGDVARKLSMIWNMYDFFTMYAEVDGWEWGGKHSDPTELCRNPLDSWIVSRVHQLTAEVEKHMDIYDIPNAMKPILPFIDDASNWYVRRSRRRFWKSDELTDKEDAYRTLHYVLTQLSIVLAPFTPFLAEELYHKLTGGESVHLLDWPTVGHINELSIHHMQKVRELINQGLSQRAAASIKVRQPLKKVTVYGVDDLAPELIEIIAEELNVKEVISNIGGSNEAEIKAEIDTSLTDELRLEGLMREIVRQVQSARKQAELDVDDRISLDLTSTVELVTTAIATHKVEICHETLATKLTQGANNHEFTQTVKVDGHELTLALSKV